MSGEYPFRHVEIPDLNRTESPEHVSTLLDYPEKKEDGTEYTVAWKKVSNEFGEVEVSEYQQDASTKAIYYVPGIGGSIDKFKDKYLPQLLKKGYTVLIVHRNGSVIGKDARTICSAERVNFGEQNGQDHIGSLPEYGYKEWTKELACALADTGTNFDDIRVIGESFGGLICIESMRALQQANHPVLQKVKNVVSATGKIGMPVEKDGIHWSDTRGKLAVFSSDGEQKQEKYSFEKIFSGYIQKNVLRIRDPKVIGQEHLDIMKQLYAPETKLPEVTYVHAMPFGEEFFSPMQGRELRKKIKTDGGKFVFINDFTQKGTPAERHGMPNLTADTLLTWLEYEPKSNIETKTQGEPGQPLEDASISNIIKHTSQQ